MSTIKRKARLIVETKSSPYHRGPVRVFVFEDEDGHIYEYAPALITREEYKEQNHLFYTARKLNTNGMWTYVIYQADVTQFKINVTNMVLSHGRVSTRESSLGKGRCVVKRRV